MTSAPEDWIRIGLQVLVVLVLGLGGCHLQGVASKSTSRPPIQGVHKKCLHVWSLILLRAPCSTLLTPPLLCPPELRNSFADCRRSSHPKLPCSPRFRGGHVCSGSSTCLDLLTSSEFHGISCGQGHWGSLHGAVGLQQRSLYV